MAIRQIRFVSDGSEYGGNYIDVATGQAVNPTPLEQVASQAYSQSGGGVPWDQFAQQYLGQAGSNIGFQGTPEALNAAVTGSNYQSLFPTQSGGDFLSNLGDIGTLGLIGAMGAAPLWAGAAGAGFGGAAGGGAAAAPAGAAPAFGGGGAVEGALGSGLKIGAAGATGITPGVVGSGAAGMGTALGTGLSIPAGATATSLGALGPGYFAAEGLGSAGGGAGGALGGLGTPPVGTAKTLFDKVTDTAKTAAPFAPLLGAAIGAGAGALGGSGSQGSITVEDGIPDWLMPYMKPALDRYSTELQNYQTDPYGIMPSAMTEFKNTISGQYLDPSTNKYLPEYFRLGAERVKGTLSPSFGHMQAFGGNTGYNEALSRGLSDLAVGLYGGAYDKERTRQNEMIAAAPNFLTQSSQSTFAPMQGYLSTLGGLGKKREEPFFQPSPLSSIFGGALTGYSLGNIFK